MKKILILLLLCAGVTASQASDYPYVVIHMKDGSQTAVSSKGLSLKVSDGHLVATYADGSAVFDFAGLESMEFSETTAGISPALQSPDASAADAKDAVPATGVYVIKSKNGTYKAYMYR